MVSHLVDHEYLLKRLAVEGLDAQAECIVYLLVALSHTGIDNLVGRKAAVVSVQHLVAAYAVCSESLGTYIFKQPPFHIGFHSIMHVYLVCCSKFSDMVHSLVKEIHVVIIERSRYLVELLYNIEIQHLILFEYVYCLSLGLFAGKTVAKITKKSVISQPDS